MTGWRNKRNQANENAAGATKPPQFAPVPIRAANDARIAAGHWRLLSIVCYHDRLSAVRTDGQGCWASNKTLSQKSNINYTNVSTYLGNLIEWGYLTRETHPTDRRRNVLRVNYTDSQNQDSSSKDEGHRELVRSGEKSCQRIHRLAGREYIPLKRNRSISSEVRPLQSSPPAPERCAAGKDVEFLKLIASELQSGAFLDSATEKLVLEALSRAPSDSWECSMAKWILEKWRHQ